jgi:hypothetical protein
LGLFEFDGSKRNNIIWTGPGSHCFTPFLDQNPNATADARIKAITRTTGGLMVLKSPDCIRWSPIEDGPVITKGAFDSQNLAFYDIHLGKYREYHRMFRKVRDIMTSTSDDFVHWTEPQFLDYPNAPPEHLYTNAVMPYPGASHLLIGFPTRFLPETQQTEPTLMVSRDGTTFQRYPKAIIPITAPADRDGNRSNYAAWGLTQLPDHPSEWSLYAKEAYYAGSGSRIRRFSYGANRLVALTADSTGGDAVTRPITVSGNKLLVNYRTSDRGALRIELLSADGQPISGFSAAQCKPLIGDSLEAAVEWNSGATIETLVGKPFRLRFVLEDAELFAFRSD